MGDRVFCSDEKTCGCFHVPRRKGKDRNGNKIILLGEPIINPAMKNCVRYIGGRADTKYCCLANKFVSLLK